MINHTCCGCQIKKTISNIKEIINRLKNAENFSVKELYLDDCIIHTKIEYKNNQFDVEIFLEKFEMLNMYKTQHLFLGGNPIQHINADYGGRASRFSLSQARHIFLECK